MEFLNNKMYFKYYLSNVDDRLEMLFPKEKASLAVVLDSRIKIGNQRRKYLSYFGTPATQTQQFC
jgi:hypothetical protein